MLISHTVHRSLLRPQTFLGCERKPCMLHLFVCLIIGVCSFSLKGIVLSLAIAVTGYVLLLKIGKEDLMFSRIYVRSLKYRGLYRGKALIIRTNLK